MIWLPGKKSLHEPFVKLLAQGSITSNTEYWCKVKVLFDHLNAAKQVETTELIKWVNDGLLPGAAKEMRPSAETAYKITLNVLIELISSIEDRENRNATLQAEFGSKLHQYITSTESPAAPRRDLTEGFSAALLNLGSKDPEACQTIWRLECQALQDSILKILVPPDNEASFKVASLRWLALFTSMLPEAQKSTNLLSSLVKPVNELINTALQAISNAKSSWVDGVLFVSALLEDSNFGTTLRTSEDLEPMRQNLFDFMSSSNIMNQLHSESAGPFIRVIVSFCILFGEKAGSIWRTFTGEVFPADQNVNVLDRGSLLSKITEIPAKQLQSLRGVVTPVGDYQNFAGQLTAGFQEGVTLDKAEQQRLEGLLVSLVLLRGVLITDEAATNILWSLNQNSDFIFRIVESICRLDPTFLSTLLLPLSTDADIDAIGRKKQIYIFISNVYLRQRLLKYSNVLRD
jgi:hypothetical protein